MAELEIFEFPATGERIQAILRDDKPWFDAVGLCTALGLDRTRDALSALDPDEKVRDTIAGTLVDLVSESGFYSLVLRSRKPEAKAFRKWVTSIVLPSIRKTGTYGRELTRLELAEMIVEAEKERLAIESELVEATERVEELTGHIAQIGPEAGAWRALASAGDDWLVEDVARILNRDAAVEIGAKRLWSKLYEWDLMTRYRERPQPRQTYIDRGYFRVRIVSFPDPKGGLTPKSAPQVRVTYKGIKWLHHKLGGVDPVDDLMADGHDAEAA